MPLWKIHSSPEVITEADQQAIAQAATAFYQAVGLPDYYVHVLFQPINAYYNAGKLKHEYVTVLIDHVARHASAGDHEMHSRVKDAVESVMKPFTTARGLHLEFLVSQSDPFMWRIDGIDPPESFQADQKDEIERAKSLLKQKFGY